MNQLFVISGFGFLLGLRHALDADHVVAVSTMVSETQSLWRASWMGAVWGLGHTLTLLAMSLPVLLGGWRIPEALAQGAELLVGLMLVVLGATTIIRLLKQKIQARPHRHRKKHHHALPWKTLAVGMVHGLAGSGALLLIVLGSFSEGPGGILYVLLFGAGSMVGMLSISLLVALPLSLAKRSSRLFYRALLLTTGTVSCALGVWIVIGISLMEGFVF